LSPFQRILKDYPEDIHAKIARDFEGNAEAAAEMIATHLIDNPTSDRVLRCVLFVASGNLSELAQCLKLAHLDYRDMIVAAEYNEHRKQVRDFNNPFGEEAG
jgi:hypothetical protein